MNDNPPHSAFGAPGTEPRWTSSAKQGVGTAYSSGANVWFTLSHGIVNEIYFPHIDTPNVRDLQFLVTDGETFCHEERRDFKHEVSYPEENALLYRLVNTAPGGRYRLIKDIIVEPHSAVFLMRVRLEIEDPELVGKLRLYALLAPHLKGTGKCNSAWLCETGNRKLFGFRREDMEMSFACQPDFLRRSAGYVGASDGWTDLMDNFQMDWEFRQALDGNVAVMGEIDLSQGMEFTLGVGFGETPQSASTHVLQAFALPFSALREKFVRQWQRTRSGSEVELRAHTGDEGSMFRLSQCVLLAHEDKLFRGAMVASLSIPWGETKDDSDMGGYHLVWPRDMVQSATALLACGQRESPLRALIWLSCVQEDDGSLPQNSFINGRPYWTGTQLDEIAAPVLLAWRLRAADGLREFDPWTLVSQASRFLVTHGPVTIQERWEENAGYSPSTLATVIAALVCTAEFAHGRKDKAAAGFLFDYADWLVSHLEDWMVTRCGELVEGKPRHYLRITPADPEQPYATADPDHAQIDIANGGGRHPARNIIGGDFLHLVRLGIRPADDPVILDSIEVMDAVIRRELPQGPGWRRYNHDGYGQKSDGSPFEGTGEGRCWPILSGERGHYELAGGRDPLPYIKQLENFTNDGGMLPEQVWDDEDRPEHHMIRGGPTGAAMPLCWSHAEYVSLVRSRHDGKCFDRIEPAYQRYVQNNNRSTVEIWTFAHRLTQIDAGKTLRLICEADCKVSWSADNWGGVHEIEATRVDSLNLWFVDLPAKKLPASTRVEFTFFWTRAGRWEGRNEAVVLVSRGEPMDDPCTQFRP